MKLVVLCDSQGKVDKERAIYFLPPVCNLPTETYSKFSYPLIIPETHHMSEHQTRPSHGIHWEDVKGHRQGVCVQPQTINEDNDIQRQTIFEQGWGYHLPHTQPALITGQKLVT